MKCSSKPAGQMTRHITTKQSERTKGKGQTATHAIILSGFEVPHANKQQIPKVSNVLVAK